MMSGSDILFTTVHVITDWPISDHVIGTSHRGPIQQSVLCCVWRTQRAPIVVPRAPRQWQIAVLRAPFINGHLTLHCHRPAIYMQRPVGKWLK
ncbi:unnamed protein product, partial [Staurois parvus]